MTFFHPKDLMDIYQRYGAVKSKGHVDHLTYKLNYFIDVSKNKEGKLKFNKKNQPITIHPSSTQIIEQMLDYRLRQLANLSQRQVVRIQEGTLISHLVHGLGAGHVTETAMTIHSVYGVPYIPASSVKGIVRHWFLQTFCDGVEKRIEENDELSIVYEDVFGSQEHSGKVSFFDVFIPSGTLIPDVMTVHFPSYYKNKGKRPAGDDDSPKPILFYTVQSDARIEFPFMITMLRKPNSPFTHEQLAEIVSDWLQKAMSELGIGSKTASGYGHFHDWKDVTDEKIMKLQQRMKREQEERIQAQEEKAAQEKEEALLESMTEEEQLVYLITNLKPNNEQDKAASKNEHFIAVLETENVKAAEALKAYWQQTNEWKIKAKPKKKQEVKVMQLRKLLNEL